MADAPVPEDPYAGLEPGVVERLDQFRGQVQHHQDAIDACRPVDGEAFYFIGDALLRMKLEVAHLEQQVTELRLALGG